MAYGRLGDTGERAHHDPDSAGGGGHRGVQAGGEQRPASQPVLVRALVQHHAAQVRRPIHHAQVALHTTQSSSQQASARYDDTAVCDWSSARGIEPWAPPNNKTA